MRYRKLSTDGDYTFGNGQADFYRDVPEAVAQACKTRLQLWLGEWFLDLDDGTPYLQGVLGKHSQPVPDLTIVDRARGTEGLTGLTDYQSTVDPDTRTMDVSFKIDTIYGPTPVEIANYGNI